VADIVKLVENYDELKGRARSGLIILTWAITVPAGIYLFLLLWIFVIMAISGSP